MMLATMIITERILRMSRLHLPVILQAVVTSLALADSPPGAPAEKLILDFERAELAATVALTCVLHDGPPRPSKTEARWSRRAIVLNLGTCSQEDCYESG
jgi:hypothetical protein